MSPLPLPILLALWIPLAGLTLALCMEPQEQEEGESTRD